MGNFLSRLFGESTPKTATQNSTFDPHVQAALLAIDRKDWDTALAAYEEGLQNARNTNDPRAQQFFLSGLGTVYYKIENYDEAERVLLQALTVAQTLNDPVLTARSYINLGENFSAQEAWDQAQNYHEQAVETARQSKDSTTISLALENLARVYLGKDNPSYAIHLLREAVTVAQEARDARTGASTLGWLGKANIASGNRAEGRNYLEQAQRLGMQTGRERLALKWVMELANLDLQEERYRDAVERYHAVENLARTVQKPDPDFYRELAQNLSDAHRHLGDFTQSQLQAERALAHAQEMGHEKNIALATQALGLALQGRGEYREAIEKLHAVLDFYQREILSGEAEHARILMSLGKCYQRLNDFDQAQGVYQQALDMARAVQNRLREAEALHLLGTVENARGNRTEAIQQWQQAIRLFEDEAQYGSVARVQCDLGNARRLTGALKSATTDFENALERLSSFDDQVTRGLVLSNAANLYTQLGDMENAEAFYNESIQIAQKLRDVHSEAIRRGNLAWFYILTGQTNKAMAMFDISIALARQTGDKLLIGIQTNNKAYAISRKPDHEAALQMYYEARDIADELKSQRWMAIIESNIAVSYMAQDQDDNALQLLLQSLETSAGLQDQENVIRTQTRLGAFYLKRGEHDQVREYAEAAYDEARKMGYRKGQADAGYVLGKLYEMNGDEETAKAYLGESHRIYKMVRDPQAETLAAYA